MHCLDIAQVVNLKLERNSNTVHMWDMDDIIALTNDISEIYTRLKNYQANKSEKLNATILLSTRPVAAWAHCKE